MNTITKQWLQHKISDMEEHRNLFPGDLDDDHGSVLAALRIALASLEAQAAAWDYELASCITCEGPQGFKRVIEHEYPPEWAIEEGRARNIVPLYAAPPAPVSVPDEVTAEDCPAFVKYDITEVDEAWVRGFNAFRAAMLHGADGNSQAHSVCRPAQNYISPAQCGNSPVIQGCSCLTCRPVTFSDSRFVVCPECGNKRCPHANDHRNACTGSNEPGQEGSAYPAAPRQEDK